MKRLAIILIAAGLIAQPAGRIWREMISAPAYTVDRFEDGSNECYVAIARSGAGGGASYGQQTINAPIAISCVTHSINTRDRSRY